MLKTGILFLLVLTFGISVSSAQTASAPKDSLNNGITGSEWRSRGLILGGHVFKYAYGELGYFSSVIKKDRGVPTLATSTSYGLEFSYFDKLVVAPKIQKHLYTYLINMSLSALCYTDVNSSYALKIRPELGFGLWNLNISYGYNVGVFKKGILPVNTHVVSIRYYLNLNKKHLSDFSSHGVIDKN